ncbi:hypothetical protein AMJ49_00885 [Parcubacteria bacterium DG_74_2]|nr:MAG: hypothetical protein AMJ49_00885 [Parcubacteria bacterium DG_74_2]
MFLKEKIQKSLTEAMREKKEIEVSALRLVLNTIFNREKEKRYKIAKENPEKTKEELEKESQLTDEEIINALFSEIKKRKESILEFEKGKRMDLVEREKKEIEVLQKYLPEQISEEEIKKLAQKVIEKVGAKELKNMGKVMSELMPKLKGKAEGDKIAKIVRELLS